MRTRQHFSELTTRTSSSGAALWGRWSQDECPSHCRPRGGSSTSAAPPLPLLPCSTTGWSRSGYVPCALWVLHLLCVQYDIRLFLSDCLIPSYPIPLPYPYPNREIAATEEVARRFPTPETYTPLPAPSVRCCWMAPSKLGATILGGDKLGLCPTW